MNRIAVGIAIVPLVLLFAGPAYAQSSSTATAPLLQQEEPKKTAADSRPRDREPRDARHCLEFPTNLQIIMCAEKYRWNRTQPAAPGG